jgi:cell division protein FtsB
MRLRDGATTHAVRSFRSRLTDRNVGEEFPTVPRSEALEGLASAMRSDQLQWMLDQDGVDAEMPVGALSRVVGESPLSRGLLIALIAAIGLLVVRPIGMSLMSYHRTANLLNERRSEVRSLAVRHSALQRKVEYYRSDVFLKERARQYGLATPGETTYVVRELANPNRLSPSSAAAPTTR